ncbi:MAG: hypothetical protein OXF54_02765 [Caldilineaceae bacterium]|nr:hypothetical protein [Caldilineaceae bacterium]
MSENVEELLAKLWLANQGYTGISSQAPNDPPDFVVGKSIAVEVRRLNWMDDSDEGVETDEYALTSMIEEVLEEAGEPPGGYDVDVKCQTHGVSLGTRKDKKSVKQTVTQFVAQYAKKIDGALQSGERPESWITGWECGMRLRFSSGLISRTSKFELVDVEAEAASRGWVVSDSIDNINRCIVEKTDTIKDKICLYPEWWLVLVAHNIDVPGSWEQDRWQTVRDNLVDTRPWSRIVVLNQTDHLISVDLIGHFTQD